MKKKLLFLMFALVAVAAFAETGTEKEITDVLTLTTFGVSGTNYADVTGKTATSDAVYAANMAGGNEAIQLRSKNNSGIITTETGGKVKSVTLTWNTNTAATRTVSVYGSNTAYTSVADLYDEAKQGTLIGEMNVDDATENVSTLAVSDEYTYIGIRSKSNALYLDKVAIVWEAEVPAVEKPAFSIAEGSYVGSQKVEITCPTKGATVYYTTDGTEPTAESTAYTAAISIEATATLKAIAINGEDKSKVASATYTILPKIANTIDEPLSIGGAAYLIEETDPEALAHPDNKVYVEGVICKIDKYNENYKSITYWISFDGTEDEKGQLQCYSGKGLNGADFTSAEDLTVGVPVIVYGNLKKYKDIYEFDANNQLAAYQNQKDITIAAADITGGDINAAITAAIPTGWVAGNISITLDGATAYTVNATIEAGGAITIAGNGATIDASALEANMFAMSGAPTTWTAADVNISGVTVKGLKKALFYSTSKNYVANNFVIDNCVVELAADATTIDYTKGSTALNLTITNSTFYAPTKTTKSFYSSQGGQKATEYASDAIQTFTFKNNTMYNLAPGKNFFSHRQSNQKWLAYDVENNIFVDCGKSGQTIKGMNGGQNGKNPTWTIKGNLFNYGGADTSAAESTGDAEEPVQESVAGIITFTDAAAGNLNGSVLLAPEATQPEALGDARWTLAYATSQAINIAEGITNGTVAVDKTSAAEGATITITATPAEGYEVSTVSVTGITTDLVVVVTKDETTGNYTFVMPNDGVTVNVIFQYATGIENVKADNLENAEIYNLNGQRVQKAQKGLYIINGRKVVIK